jgi:hypothetical protein
MRIHSASFIHFPIDRVYATYRDRLPEVAAFMPDIREIEVVRRAETPRGPDILNIWKAENRVPSVAQKVVSPEMLQWEDHAEWDDGNTWVDWTLVIPAFRDQVRCSGRNRFEAHGPKTRVVLEGELDIDIQRIPGVPRLLAGRMKPQIEQFIIKLVQPNLEKVNGSLERFMDAEA